MREPLNAMLAGIRQMMRAADIDHAALEAQPIDDRWLADYERQRIVDSFLFNCIKLQDKIGGKLFRALLAEWRELDGDDMPMIDVLNRLEKLSIQPSVAVWDELREVRNAIAHEYPEDIETRLANIPLALRGYEQIRSIVANIERALGFTS